jgi:hypothetical protein
MPISRDFFDWVALMLRTLLDPARTARRAR